MHRETRSTAIPSEVKAAVWRRDFRRCLFCGSNYGAPHCHFIRRSQGGLGIEDNIWTGCNACHDKFDSEASDGPMHRQMEQYFRLIYPEWDKKKLIYKKYGGEF